MLPGARFAKVVMVLVMALIIFSLIASSVAYPVAV
jgi:hypothetical protein